MFGDPAGQEIEFQSRYRVAGVGATIDLKHRTYGVAAAGECLQFTDDFGNKATLAFVSHADADVGDKVTFERSESHGQEGGSER